MPTLRLLPVSAKQVRATVELVDGTVPYGERVDPWNPKALARVQRAAGVPLMLLRAWFLSLPTYEKGVKDTAYDVPGPAVEAGEGEPFVVYVRGIRQPRAEATQFVADEPIEALRNALAYSPLVDEPVIEWAGTERLAVLDVDYHCQERPVPAQIEGWCREVQPGPVLFWASHGNGGKLVFTSREGYSAGELAAVAAATWPAGRPPTGVEVACRTRHPLGRRGDEVGGPVKEGHPTADIGGIMKWFGADDSDDAREAALAEHGWQVGQRLAHTDCLIDPGYVSSGPQPVWVGEHGILCHSCAAHNKCHPSSRSPGFAPYSALVSGVEPMLRKLVRGPAHWDHARLILEARLRLPVSIHKAIYAAACKLVHGADNPKALGVFTAGRDLIRVDGRWVMPAGGKWSRDIKDILAELPACLKVTALPDGTYEAKPDKALINVFREGADLTASGYPAVSFVPAAPLWGRFLAYPDQSKITVCRPHTDHLIESGRFAPRYLPPAERLPLDVAWAELERVFPGLDRRYLELLMLAIGCAESGVSPNVFLLVEGPAGTGKSITPAIAAAICGTWATASGWQVDKRANAYAIQTARATGSVCLLDEYVKNCRAAGVDVMDAMNFLLTLTPNSTAHEMYIGAVRYGWLPVIVIADIETPQRLIADKQLGRRLMFVQIEDLPGAGTWSDTTAAAGLSEVHHLRRLSIEMNKACDTILSHVIDTHFRQYGSFEQKAASIGYHRLNRTEFAIDPNADLLEFFDLVCAAPECYQKQYTGEGWKLIKPTDTGPLREAWDSLANKGEWTASRRVKEASWRTILNSPETVRFVVHDRQGCIYVRFDAGGSAKLPKFVNSAIPRLDEI